MLALSVLIISGCGTKTATQSTTANTEQMEKPSPRSIAQKGMEAFFVDYDEAGVKTYFTENYIQHNPGIPTGIAPVIGFLPVLKEAGTSMQTHRIFQDGDMVVMHNTYDNAEAFGGPQVVTFDVLRVENGKLAEHWDAIQPLVTETASGRTQYDGPSEIVDLDQTDANKALVKNFIDDILFGKNPGKMTDYVSTETYHQHNPAIKDGLDGLGEALEYLGSINDMFVYEKVHRILGEGNFVLSVSEGMWHGKKQAFYDLFRIEGGKIVEHWDVIQEVPAEMAHQNGMF